MSPGPGVASLPAGCGRIWAMPTARWTRWRRRCKSAGVSVSPSTVNRWARGQGAPSVFAARELGRLVEQAGLAPEGGGTAWLLGDAPVVTASSPALDRAVGAWHFRAADAALADALAERGIPAGYRAPLAELLGRLLEELGNEPDAAPDSRCVSPDRPAGRWWRIARLARIVSGPAPPGGSGSVVEHLLAKERVTGSNPVFRSIDLSQTCCDP